MTIYTLEPGPDDTTRVQLSVETVPATITDRAMEMFGARSWTRRQNRRALRAPALDPRGRHAPRPSRDDRRPLTIRLAPMLRNRLGMLIGALAGAAALAGCGAGEHARYADNLGPGYVELDQLNYQIQISRELNPYDATRTAPISRASARASARCRRPTSGSAISLQVYNWIERRAHADATLLHHRHARRPLRPDHQPGAQPVLLRARSRSRPASSCRRSTSDAFAGWTQGELLIFKIPYTSLPDRPFVLHIVNPYERVRPGADRARRLGAAAASPADRPRSSAAGEAGRARLGVRLRGRRSPTRGSRSGPRAGGRRGAVRAP